MSGKLRGLVGAVGVLGHLDGLDVGVRFRVSVCVLSVLGRLLDDRVRLGSVVCVMRVLGRFLDDRIWLGGNLCVVEVLRDHAGLIGRVKVMGVVGVGHCE
jgi:hypothetical protein